MPKVSNILWCVVIAAVSFGVFFNYLDNQWVYDDEYLILGSQWYQEDFKISDIFEDLGVTLLNQEMGYWRPGQLLLYKFEYMLFGENPFGWHLTALLLHIMAGWTLFFLLKYFLKNTFLTGLLVFLFIVHPANSEVVGSNNFQISAAEGIFAFLCIFAFLKGRFIFSALFLAGALSFRESAIMLLFVSAAFLPLIEKSRIRKYQFGLLALLVVEILYFLIRSSVVGSKVLQAENPIGILDRMGLIADLAVKAIILPIPGNLSILHEPLPALIPVITGWIFILVILMIEGWLIKSAIKNGKPLPACLFGATILLAAPYSGILAPYRLFAEHYLYLPLAFAMATAGYFAGQIKKSKPVVCALVALIIIFGFISIQRSEVFKDNGSAFSEVIAKYPLSVTAHLSLGTYYYRSNDWEKAVYHLEEVLKLTNGKNEKAWNNLGDIHFRNGSFNKAEACFKNADKKGEGNLIILLMSQKRYKEAIVLIEKFINQHPDDETYVQLLEKAKRETVKEGE